MTQNENDETRVVPVLADHQVDEDATVFKPVHARSGNEGTATRSASRGTGEGRWRHIADLAQGERITVGSLLKGRFLMERELGRGGMGVVYLARDERKVEARDRDPYVAVKVLNDEFRRHPDALMALQRESRRAQQLGSDHIVRVYDFDKDGTNVFMTMEYVEGSDLRTLIRTEARDGMPLAQAWPLIQGMAEALRRAHDAGIVHSDFKPGNVMVNSTGVAKVFDFGIARAGKIGIDAGDDHTVFDAGSLGAMTPAYASLEMIQGKAPAPADDIYAFGCVVFELLTGQHPFGKETAEEAMRLERRPPPVPGLDKCQYKALCDAIAFTAAKRSDKIDNVLANLRKRRWQERGTRWLVVATLMTVVAASGAWITNRHIEQQHVSDTLRRFTPGQADGFHDENSVLAALTALDGDERRQVVVDGADKIDNFLVRMVAASWSPDVGRFDYVGAQRVFALRRQLKTFAPKLDRRREQITHERDTVLNQLDTRLSQAILGDRLVGGGEDHVPAILAHIRAIDPSSRLLDNPELKLKLAALSSTPTSDSAPTIPAPVAREAELATRMESLRRAVAANDLDKALQNFGQLRQVEGKPAQADAEDDAANLLTGVFLDAAHSACSTGHWKEAIERVNQGLSVIGSRPDLVRASTRYQLALAVMSAAHEQDISTRDRDDLRKRIESVQAEDPDGLKDLESAMTAAKALPQGTLENVVKKLHVTSVVTAPADPCARHGLAGTTRECFDTFSAGEHGPALVVIPHKNKPFAMSRAEITVDNLDQYCRSTRTCTVARGLPPNQPARSISVAFAKRYAAWLSRVSTHTYRLPSEEEWLLAARANAGWDSKVAECGVVRSGLGRLIHGSQDWSSKRNINPLGLIDMVGSVWEWTTKGGRLIMHGGSYRSGPRACSVSSTRNSDGSADEDVGFRLVREIKQ